MKRLSRSTIQEIANELKINENRIRVTIETLVESGLLEAGGTGRGRYYMLSSAYYRNANIRHKYIDSIRYDALVIQLAESKGFVRRADIIDLLHITPSQAFRVLKDYQMQVNWNCNIARILRYVKCGLVRDREFSPCACRKICAVRAVRNTLLTVLRKPYPSF